MDVGTILIGIVFIFLAATILSSCGRAEEAVKVNQEKIDQLKYSIRQQQQKMIKILNEIH